MAYVLLKQDIYIRRALYTVRLKKEPLFFYAQLCLLLKRNWLNFTQTHVAHVKLNTVVLAIWINQTEPLP